MDAENSLKMSGFESFDITAFYAYLPVALVIIFVFILNVYDKFIKEYPLSVADKKHTWKPVNSTKESFRCSICDLLMVKKDGVYCDSCGVCVDSRCIKQVAGRFKCKEITLPKDQPMHHRWLKGNLPEGCMCDICQTECTEDDKRCIWCHRTVHVGCEAFYGKVCNFGKLREVILPPTHVVMGKKKGKSPLLKDIIDPAIKDWKPIFVIGNPSSGSMVGAEVLSGFRYLLNPVQVTELSRRMLDRLSFILSLLPPHSRPIILVAGGDGSVAAVLSALNSPTFKIRCGFRVGIVPLGTGNDLARVLKWGSEEPNPFYAREVLDKLLEAETVALDRWCVKITKTGALGMSKRKKELFVYNYLSVGVDALVTLDFHKARHSPLYLGGRLLNKALYLAFGTQQVVEKKCTGLEKEVGVELDDAWVDLPPLESVVILNIPSWGAGCPLWELKGSKEEIPKQSMADGKLEVLGIESSFHMAQLKTNLSSPIRIGQASKVRLFLRKKLPMQVDGEPWMQPPCVLEVTYGGQVSVLQAVIKESPETVID